jgi:hypothetical protein
MRHFVQSLVTPLQFHVPMLRENIKNISQLFLEFVEMHLRQGASVAQSSEQAPFTSEFVGSILATDSCEKSQRSAESRRFSLGWVI